MHGDAAELAVYLLALAGVHAGAHVDAESLNRYDNCRSARERTSRLGERREEPVPGGVLLPAAVVLELVADDPAESRQQLAPARVAELGGQGSRADDVQEQHRRQAAPHSTTWHASIIRRTTHGA